MTAIKVEAKKAHELNSKTYLPFNIVYISAEESFCVCIGGKVIDIVDFIDDMTTRAICNDDFEHISKHLFDLDPEIANLFIIAYEMNINL